MKKVILTSLFYFALYSFVGAQVMLNEFSAANLSTITDDFKKHEDWIELYNAGNADVNLAGYYLSDDLDEPKKWKFPNNSIIKAQSYLVIWCDGRDSVRTLAGRRHYHSNFKLSQTKKTPENIIFSDATGKKIDEVKVLKTRADQSRGRSEDGNNQWVIFTIPSPNNANNGTFYVSNAERPVFSVKAGFYTAPQTITITTKEPNATIYYTTDGTEPTAKSKKYTAPVVISTTQVLKAIAVSAQVDIQPSLMEFATYFINEKHGLYVVSISGTFELDSLANGNKNYAPFGAFELFDETGDRKAATYGEYNSHGQDSWVNNQRSLDFISRDECGYNNAIKHQIFKGLSERDEFQRIILRAAGDDNYPDGSQTIGGGAHMRDAYLQNLAKRGGMHLDVRTAEKAILYLNGQYWGVYDLREKPNDHDFTEFYYGQGKYDLQYLQTWATTWAEYGDQKAISDWNKLVNYVKKNDMKDNSKFEAVINQLDVKSLTDYVITNSVSVCSDWLNYNTGWWRGLNPNGGHQKWGFHLWDNDASFGYYINYTGIPDTAATKAKACDVELLKDSVLIKYEAFIAEDTMTIFGQIFYPGDTISPAFEYKDFVDLNSHLYILQKLRENPTFNQYYVTRYADLIHTVFSKQNMLAYFDEIYQKIKPEMPRHVQRWGGTMQGWERNVAKLRNYISRRCDYLSGSLKDCYQLTGPYDVTFEAEGTSAASIEINSQLINKFPYVGPYYGNIPLKVVATSNDKGFAFEEWTNSLNSTNITNSKQAATTIDIKNNEKIVAKFVKAVISTNDQNAASQFKVTAFPTVFDNSITVNYELTEAASVRVAIIDMAGRIIAQVNDFDTLHNAGSYTMQLDMASLALGKGVYIIDFQAGKDRQTLKVVKQ
jgi:hypothetical protein